MNFKISQNIRKVLFGGITMKIFINSGHCIGADPGACGNGIEEAKVCWNISNRVSKYLQAVGYVTKVFSFD